MSTRAHSSSPSLVPDGQTLIHATTVARAGVAALLRGPSGSGKSDLALRFIANPLSFPATPAGLHTLVADDVRRNPLPLLITKNQAVQNTHAASKRQP